MKLTKIPILLFTISTLTSCASRYKTIEPKAITYLSSHEKNSIKLEYKYDLLNKKYKKKELKKGIKFVAIKITNNSGKDVMFGKDIFLTYESGLLVNVMDKEQVYSILKQQPASYLWYLLLTPINLYTSSSNGMEEDSNTFPIGLILGPGIAGGNMIAASSANNKFKAEISDYNINESIIKKGETKYGLIGIKTDSYEALKIKVE